MTVEAIDTKAVTKAVREAIEKYGSTEEELIPILSFINHKAGYLPQQAMEEIAEILKIPQSQLLTVASFYQMLSTKPRGKHVIKFCESAPCHVVGGKNVWSSLKAEIKLDASGTTEDGKWTLVTTSCLGVCAVGPVIIVDDDIYGNVTPDQIPQILSHYQ
jgi:NADH-quinone oxidoreductase subunit E